MTRQPEPSGIQYRQSSTSIISRANALLDKINMNLDLTHELQSEIHPEVFFRRNTVNLLIGKKGSGKTYNVFREIIKLGMIPNHLYTKFIYVTDKAFDPTFERVKEQILTIMAVDKVSYAKAVDVIHDIADAKNIAHSLKSGELKLSSLSADAKQELADRLGIKNAEECLTREIFHTIVLLDDCQDVFAHKTPHNKALFKLLFENRQPKITYFLTQQDAKGVDSSLRQNLDGVWVFGGFAFNKFNYLMRQVPHEEDIRELWDLYKTLTKNQALVFDIQYTGTQLIVIKH